MNKLLEHLLQLEILCIVFLQLFDRLRLLDVLLPQAVVLLNVLLQKSVDCFLLLVLGFGCVVALVLISQVWRVALEYFALVGSPAVASALTRLCSDV